MKYCARLQKWRTCANEPSAKFLMRACTASPALPATYWQSPTICIPCAGGDQPDPNYAEAADAKVKALIEGVELTERELLKSLEKNGVTKFSPEGEKFDPNVHQAMYEVPTSELPPGQVAQVIQAGYMIGDRVLRPAMVAVSKAAAKSASSANDNPRPGDRSS